MCTVMYVYMYSSHYDFSCRDSKVPLIGGLNTSLVFLSRRAERAAALLPLLALLVLVWRTLLVCLLWTLCAAAALQ